MQRRNQFVNSRGEIVDSVDGICPDGCHVVTTMMMLDGTQQAIARARIVDAFGLPAGHAPGYAFMDAGPSTEAHDAREAYKARLTDEWRSPPAATHAAAATDSSATGVDAAEAAYAAHDAWLRDAWRTAR